MVWEWNPLWVLENCRELEELGFWRMLCLRKDRL